MCGHVQTFVRQKVAIRETYPCEKCRGSLREREQARAILWCHSSAASTLSEFVHTGVARGLRIYEPGTMGPFRKHLASLAGYTRSAYYGDPSDATAEVPHQSLEALTFSDDSFDLVLTSDILEHVRRPEAAFSEIARVLRRGGHHVFTVPMQDPVRPKTVSRIELDGDRDIHVRPAVYHGRSIVYNDFGLDIVSVLSRVGFSTYLMNAATPSTVANAAITLVTQKVA